MVVALIAGAALAQADTWTEQVSNSPVTLYVVHAVNDEIAWAAGDGGQVVGPGEDVQRPRDEAGQRRHGRLHHPPGGRDLHALELARGHRQFGAHPRPVPGPQSQLTRRNTMEVIYGLIPGMIILGLVAVGVLFWAARSGQFDDLDTPATRILLDDDRATGVGLVGGAAQEPVELQPRFHRRRGRSPRLGGRRIIKKQRHDHLRLRRR